MQLVIVLDVKSLKSEWQERKKIQTDKKERRYAHTHIERGYLIPNINDKDSL